jgi:hypothetical protein
VRLDGRLGQALVTPCGSGGRSLYIDTVVRRYRGQIREWDVVNEPLGTSGRLYAQRHGLAVRGHAFVWDEQLQAWIRDRSWTRPQLVSVLRRSGPGRFTFGESDRLVALRLGAARWAKRRARPM